MRYAIFLRGVNVGGVTLTNAQLLDIAHTAGFDDAAAVLASGNLLVENDMEASAVQDAIQDALAQAFGTPVGCFVRTAQQLEELLLQDDTQAEGFHHYLIFCKGEPFEELHALYQEMPTAPGERLFAKTSDFHWIVMRDNTLGAFGSKIMGSRYKDRLTSRNIRTVQKVLAALQKPGPLQGKPKKR